MKGNDGTGNTVQRDDWETPKEWFNHLNKQYNFSLDCCATKENTKCIFWETDFLNRNLINNKNTSWMNPPFSKATEMFEHFFKLVKKGVAIYRCDNFETKIWQEVIFPNADWILIPNTRICYEHKERKMNGARFPSALIGIGVPKPTMILGVILEVTGRHYMRKQNEVRSDE